MTREDYLKYRRANMIGEIAYHYYLENCDNPYPTQFFIDAFRVFFHSNKQIKWSTLFLIYDVRFEVTILEDKNKKIIKIY